MSVRRFWGFPNPVNEVAARLVATGVALLTGSVALFAATWLLVPITYGFVARVVAGPRLSPLGLLVTRILVPRLPLTPRYGPGPPKRFAQMIGAMLAVTASVLAFGFQQPGAARIVAAVIAAAATLEAAFGLCVGCRIFAGLMRLGVIPAAVCAECADLRHTETAAW
jgi:hypothetical protein